MTSTAQVDVAIVGAGPAGSTLAASLARRGLDVLVLEQAPVWHWRAGGVFTSPAAVSALERAGVDPDTLEDVARPIAAMRLETPGGTHVRLTYGADRGGRHAVGFDRSGLDPALEELARQAGATIRRGAEVRAVRLPSHGPATLELADGIVSTSIVVGADGAHSVVARAAGVGSRAGSALPGMSSIPARLPRTAPRSMPGSSSSTTAMSGLRRSPVAD